jgi:hypothetical protein
MDKGKLTFHSNAVNLARRLTELNENDLMMVSGPFVLAGRVVVPQNPEALIGYLFHSYAFPLRGVSLVS